MSRAFFSWSSAALLSVAVGVGPVQASYPERPISLVVTSTPGSPLDILGRTLAAEAAKDLGQPIVVENRAGASGNIGGSLVANSAPDGYTLILALANLATVNPLLIRDTKFNASTDLEPVAYIGSFSQVLVVPKRLGVDNLHALVELARKRDLTYATAGAGSPGHLSMAAFAIATNITTLTHVPYKGNPPAVNDLLGGMVDAGFLVASGVLPHIKTGALVPLAVSGKARSDSLPGVPAVAESGIPGTAEFDLTFGYLVAMPKGTPQELIQRWNTLLHDILRRPAVQERLKAMDTKAVFLTPQETRKMLANESRRMKEIVEKADIRINN